MSVLPKLDLNFSLDMENPFALGTGTGEVMTANSLVKDIGGRFYIPGSAVKGVLRYNCARLVRTLGGQVCGMPVVGRMCFGEEMCPVCSVFGSSYFPSPLFFSDASLNTEYIELRDKLLGTLNAKQGTRLFRDYDIQYRTRTMVSRSRGVAKEKSLFTLQCSEAGLTFKGRILGRIKLTPLNDPPYFYELILLASAIKLTNCLGSGKSSGLGGCSMEIDSLLIDGEELAGMADKIFDYLDDLEIWLSYEKGDVV